MLDNIGQYFIKDHHLSKTEQVEVLASDAVLLYEVIRIVESVCLFSELHYNRLLKSAELAGIELKLSQKEFSENISQLIASNKLAAGNVKVLVQYGNNQQAVFYYIISHRYPSAEDYRCGVRAAFLYSERAMPRAKVVQQKLRQEASLFIQKSNIYDALLVNSKGDILEGSRTNVFFIKGEEFYTAPSRFVLCGITRLKVMECLKRLNYKCIEKPIPASSVGQFDAAFFTGTSPKVLPIAIIENQEFSVNHQPLLRLMDAYDKLVGLYLAESKG